MPGSQSLRSSVALAAYAESLVDGGRAAVFGDATSQLAERLVERGARLVHVYDSDPTRVAEVATQNTSRCVVYAPLGDEGLAVREGSFNVVVVEDLSLAPNPAELLALLDRVLNPRGIALVACPNPEATEHLVEHVGPSNGLDYYGLYDLVAERFEHVRMLGQTPFVGYAVVDFLTDDPEPSFDAGFVPGGAEGAEWFVALASQREVVLEEFAVVQLPLAEALASRDTKELREQLVAARAAERQARDRMAQLESTQADASRRRRERGANTEELEKLRRQLSKRDQWLQQLEDRATAADARADESQAEVEILQQRLEEANTQCESAARELRAERVRAQELAAAADRAPELEERVDRLEAELSGLGRVEAEASGDVERLEEQLVERGEEVQRLNAALREAGRTGRELLDQLQEMKAGGVDGSCSEDADITEPAHTAPSAELPTTHPDASELAARLDALAALQARREADLTAAEWTISRLVSQLEQGAGGDVTSLANDLRQAHAQLQAQAVLLHQARAAEQGDCSVGEPSPETKASRPER